MVIWKAEKGLTNQNPLAWQKHLLGLRGGVATETETS